MNEINDSAAKAVGWFFVLLFVMTGCGLSHSRGFGSVPDEFGVEATR